MPGATVTLVNKLTGVSSQATTDSAGVYDALALTPGGYTITFTKAGFKEFVRSGIDLSVEAITVDAQLEVGAVTQQVTVNANVPQVQTESAVQSVRLPAQAVVSLPVLIQGYGGGQNWQSLAITVPGLNGGGGQGLSAGGLGFNGSQTMEAAVNYDGGNANSPGGNNIDTMFPMLDAISEVNFETANFGAEYGNGTSVANVITKSGTNQWHGSLYDFMVNEAFGTRPFNTVTRPKNRQFEYGGTVGGPIKRDKAFLFFGYQRDPQWGAAGAAFGTYPTPAMRNGDFSNPAFPTIYDPSTYNSTTGTRTPFPGNIINTPLDPVATKIQTYMPMPNCGPGLKYDLAPCSLLSSNTYGILPGNNQYTTWQARLDYNASSSNRLIGSVTINRSTNSGNSLDFPNDTQAQIKNMYRLQISDIWNVSPSIVNELRLTGIREWVVLKPYDLGLGWNKQGSPNYLGLKNLPFDIFPNIAFGSACTACAPPSSLGVTNVGTGITWFISTNNYVVPSDILTWIKGRHSLKFGGEYDRTRINVAAWNYLSNDNFNFTGVFTNNPASPVGTGFAYADFLLGDVHDWSFSQGQVSAQRDQYPQLFVNDDYKIRPNLTLNLGLRDLIQFGWYDARNRVANFDPTLTQPATLSPSGNPNPYAGMPGALCYAANPATCPSRAVEQTKNLLMPRVGFAWSPKPNWSIRGGIGKYSNVYNSNDYATWLSRPSDGAFGSLNATNSPFNNITPLFDLSQTGFPTYGVTYPSVALNTPDAYNGQSLVYQPYNQPVAYLWQWRLDVQHQLKNGILVDAAYVANHGAHLQAARNLNVVPEADMMQAVQPNVNVLALTPYPQYVGIFDGFFDGISNYNAFQLSLRKQFSAGLFFVANYTYSHTLDTGGGSADACGGPCNDVNQNPYSALANYGNSKLDMRHVFNGSVVYQLPVGRGKRFLKQGGVVNQVLGGWQVASLFQFTSGIPFTPTMSGTTSTFNSGADPSGMASWFPNRIASGKLSNPTAAQWFDPTAFAPPTPGTFGTSGRNILFGPGYTDVDLALSKFFPISKLGEGGQLEIRAEATDVANHTNLGMPIASLQVTSSGTICTACGTGVIAGAAGNSNRVVQLGAKITF